MILELFYEKRYTTVLIFVIFWEFILVWLDVRLVKYLVGTEFRIGHNSGGKHIISYSSSILE